jgi:hypothetical protein
MKIGVIIPTRGDRPQMLDTAIRQMEYQTLKPDLVKIVNFEPVEGVCDITKRYRIGYDYFRGKGFEVIALIEDDDFYREDYLETMVLEWIKAGKPNIIGQTRTIYYHLKEQAWFIMNHKSRSSAMNTMLKADLDIEWCLDHDPYTDLKLWSQFYSKSHHIFTPKNIICIGLKHGVGMSGGEFHNTYLERFVNKDPNGEFLKLVRGY